jgi:hypothetical protein
MLVQMRNNVPSVGVVLSCAVYMMRRSLGVTLPTLQSWASRLVPKPQAEPLAPCPRDYATIVIEETILCSQSHPPALHEIPELCWGVARPGRDAPGSANSRHRFYPWAFPTEPPTYGVVKVPSCGSTTCVACQTYPRATLPVSASNGTVSGVVPAIGPSE